MLSFRFVYKRSVVVFDRHLPLTVGGRHGIAKMHNSRIVQLFITHYVLRFHGVTDLKYDAPSANIWKSKNGTFVGVLSLNNLITTFTSLFKSCHVSAIIVFGFFYFIFFWNYDSKCVNEETHFPLPNFFSRQLVSAVRDCVIIFLI